MSATFLNDHLLLVGAAAGLIQAGVIFLIMQAQARKEAAEAVRQHRERGLSLNFDPARFTKLAIDLGGIAIMVATLAAVVLVSIMRFLNPAMGWVGSVMTGSVPGVLIARAYGLRLTAVYLITQAGADGIDHARLRDH